MLALVERTRFRPLADTGDASADVVVGPPAVLLNVSPSVTELGWVGASAAAVAVAVAEHDVP